MSSMMTERNAMMNMPGMMGMGNNMGMMSPGMMMGGAAMMPSTMNMMMVPRCTMACEKVDDGMKMTCICPDETAAAMLQNLCKMMAGSMTSCCMMMNGMMINCCNMAMGMCRCEMMEGGVSFTWTSKDADCCKMIQSCCDTMISMMECGCTCCMCMNGTPVCCGTCC